MQQCVSALSFVYFCHAIFESEQSKKEGWWIRSERCVHVLLKLFEQWLMWCSVSRGRDEEWCPSLPIEICHTCILAVPFLRCNLALPVWAIREEDTVIRRMAWAPILLSAGAVS